MARPRRYVFTGGGTGGHVIPNLAMIREIREREPGAEIVYLGTRRGAEYKLTREEGLSFVAVPARPAAHPRHLLPFSAFATCLFLGVLRSLWTLLRFRPDVVVATGGYVSVPPALAAALLRRPIYLHEQNVTPGKANLFLSRFATRIGVSFEETLRWFPESKTELAGYPVRRRFAKGSKSDARKRLRIPSHHRVAFIVGGSMGARTINRATIDSLGRLLSSEDITIIHSTGLKKGGEYHAWEDTVLRLKSAQLPEQFRSRYIMDRYFDSIEEAYAASDLVVARPGAGTMMELAALGKPALLIPKSDAPDTHQLMNAMSLKDQGSADVLFESSHDDGGTTISRVHGDKLARKIDDLLSDPDRLDAMSKSSKSLLVPEATANNVAVIQGIAIRGNASETRETTHLVGSLSCADGTCTDLLFPVNTVGRSPTSDIQVAASKGERFQVRVGTSKTQGVQFHLAVKRGPVLVNQKDVARKAALQPGDQISIGNECLEFGTREVTIETPVEQGGVLSKILTTGLGTLTSRIFGVVRMIVLATVFGPGRIMDLFAAGLTTSNLFRRVFAENAVDSAFLPTFLLLHRSGRKKEAVRLFCTVLTSITLITTAITAVAMLTVQIWMPWMVPGWESKGMTSDAIVLTRFMMPYLVLISIAAVLGAVLKAFNRFAAPSYSSIMFNVGIIAGVALFPFLGLPALGVGLLLGGLGQIAFHVPAFFTREFRRTHKIRLRPLLAMDEPGAKKVRSAAPKIFGDVAITKMGSVVDLMIVSTLAVGHYSVLYIALLLFQLPFAIVSQSINSVVLKEFSESEALRNNPRSRRLVTSGITWNVFLLLPIAALMIVLARPLVNLLFTYGSFGSGDGSMVAIALACYSIGLVGWGLQGLMGRFYAARLEMGQAMLVNLGCVILNIGLSLSFVAMGMSYAGVALGTSLAFLTNGFFRVWHLNRNMTRDGGGFAWGEVLSSAKISTISTLSAAFVAYMTLRSVEGFGGLPTPLDRIFILLVPALAGIATYATISLGLKAPEMDEILVRIRRLGPIRPRDGLPRSSANVYCMSPQVLLDTAENRPEHIRGVNLTSRVKDFLAKPNWRTRNIGVKLAGILKTRALRYEMTKIIENRAPAPLLHRILGGDFANPGFLRRNAIKSLAQIDEHDGDVEKALLLALDDPYYEARSAAAAAVEKFAARFSPSGRHNALVRMKELAQEKNFEVVHHAVSAIQALAMDDSVLEDLRALHYHPNWQVRNAVVCSYHELYKRGVVEDRELLKERVGDVLVTSDMFVPTFELKANISRILVGLSTRRRGLPQKEDAEGEATA